MSLFSDVLKQKIPKQIAFWELILKNGFSHAYIFCGQNVELKDQLTVELIKILNCNKNKNNIYNKPCEQCINCRWLTEKNHPEIPLLLEPNFEESKKGVVLVEQVENLLKRLQNSSSFYRVILIRFAESEFLPSQAANALLKTIEETPKNMMFIFYAKDLETVLPTIRSRAQTLFLPSFNDISLSMESINLAEKIFDTNLNYFDSSKIASNIKIEDLEFFKIWCLEQFEQTENKNLLYKIKLIDKTIKRLKSFCNKNAVMEETIYLLSKS